ncbi:MAG: radical SAM/SPASM domain-containing protein [Peptococcales bacterium]
MDFGNSNLDNETTDNISKKLQHHKITMAQIDPFSYCNSKCWYCPVAYIPNPRYAVKHMPIDLLRKIISDLVEEKNQDNGIVSENFNFIYTGHYNEILLYKYFKDMLDLLREFNIKTIILSNGVPLTREKTDIITQYEDVVTGICLNIPAFDEETWTKRTGMNNKIFSKLIDNIKYAVQRLPDMVASRQFSIQINGVNKNSFIENGGWLERGQKFPQDIDLDPQYGELKTQENLAKSHFPGVNIYTVPSLIDRAGLLDRAGIMSNKRAIDIHLKKDKKVVIGCHNGFEVGGRVFGWLHVNSVGQAFLCCSDYNFGYVFGDFNTQTLREIWFSDLHKQVIQKAFKEICIDCTSSEWAYE